MMSIMSCSTETQQLEVEKQTKELNSSKEESQVLQAIEFANKSIEDKNNEEASRKVKWCPGYSSPWNSPWGGTGIAEVTLDDGSVHYVAANWEHHGVCCGGLIYETYYMGTSLPPGYSC